MKSSLHQLIVAICICITVIAGYAVWHTVLSTMDTVIAKLESDILIKTEKANKIAATRAMLSGIAGDEAGIRDYFVPETGVAAFIDSLEAYGREQGSTVSVLSVSTESLPMRSILTISLTVKGTFESIMRTVGVIEYGPYELSISKLAVAKNDKNRWSTGLTTLEGRLAEPLTNYAFQY